MEHSKDSYQKRCGNEISTMRYDTPGIDMNGLSLTTPEGRRLAESQYSLARISAKQWPLFLRNAIVKRIAESLHRQCLQPYKSKSSEKCCDVLNVKNKTHIRRKE